MTATKMVIRLLDITEKSLKNRDGTKTSHTIIWLVDASLISRKNLICSSAVSLQTKVFDNNDVTLFTNDKRCCKTPDASPGEKALWFWNTKFCEPVYA